MAAQVFGVSIGVTRSSREYEFHAGVEVLKSINQEMAVLFRRKPAQEKNVIVGQEIPLNQLPRKATGCQRGSIGDVNGIAFVLLAIVLLQSARDDHSRIGGGNRGRFSPTQNARRDPSPLAALPVQALHGDDRLLAGKPRKKRKQRRSQTVVVDDIVVRDHGMDGAQQSVDNGFQMLGTNGRQPPHAHSVVRVYGRSEIAAAIYSNLVPQAGQFVAGLLVIGFDAAVFVYHAATSDKRDANASAGLWRLRRGGERHKLLRRCEPVIEVKQLLHVLLGVVVCFHTTAGRGAHLLDQIGTVKQKSDGMRELFAVSVGIEQSGNAVLDEFPARTEIGRDDGPSPRIGLQNGFSQSLVGV